jgi:uncharacterized iron-regulated membrane protein
MYLIHRWLSIFVGVFFLAWTISGIVMLLPPNLPAPARALEHAPANFRAVELSPALAIARAEKETGKTFKIQWMNLKQIRDLLVYEIATEDDGIQRVNARTGAIEKMTPEFAEKIAREDFPTTARATKIAMIEKYDLDFTWGGLPAYRIVFDDAYGTASTVSLDGSVHRSDAWSRTQFVIGSLHTFEPIKILTGRERLKEILLIATSIVGIASALTGYYLAIRLWKFKWKS